MVVMVGIEYLRKWAEHCRSATLQVVHIIVYTYILYNSMILYWYNDIQTLPYSNIYKEHSGLLNNMVSGAVICIGLTVFEI